MEIFMSTVPRRHSVIEKIISIILCIIVSITEAKSTSHAVKEFLQDVQLGQSTAQLGQEKFNKSTGF